MLFFIHFGQICLNHGKYCLLSCLVSTTEPIPRRLKSAPPMRSLPPATVLTIPEPRFVTPIIPVANTSVVQTPPSPTIRPKTRASSAKARLNTTYPSVNEQRTDDYRQQRREIQSAQGICSPDETKLISEDQQKTIIQVYNDIVQQQEEPTPIPPASPTYVYQKPPSRPAAPSPSTPLIIRPLRSATEINSVPLNPHYVHRPGVIAANNIEKKAVVREGSASRKSTKHHRRHHHHHHHQRHHEKSNEPLLALKPITRSIKLPFELDGVKLIYDPTLTTDDPSPNLTRYFIEGSLYLIKDQRYNVLENIDPATIEKFNQTSR